MDEFATTKEMIERIKDILSPFYPDKKIMRKHVAEVLKMSTDTLNGRVYNGSPPVDNIVKFCRRTGVDPMKIIFKDSK